MIHSVITYYTHAKTISISSIPTNNDWKGSSWTNASNYTWPIFLSLKIPSRKRNNIKKHITLKSIFVEHSFEDHTGISHFYVYINIIPQFNPNNRKASSFSLFLCFFFTVKQQKSLRSYLLSFTEKNLCTQFESKLDLAFNIERNQTEFIIVLKVDNSTQ